jgi:crossover junction endodeoxyribonuclease RusA
MKSISLKLPFPPTNNRYYRKFHGRMVLSQPAREYKRAVAEIVSLGRYRMEGRLSLSVVLFPPTRRKWDIDGRLKALLDALQDAGVFEDDEQIDRLEVIRGGLVAGGGCEVVIENMLTRG